MEAVLSDEECGYYMKLITFILGIGMEVLHTYFEQNILNAKEHSEFYMFLDENKHNLFHECYPRVECCNNSPDCLASASQKGCLTKKQFMLLFEFGPLTRMDHYKTGNHNHITKECLCRINAKRSNDVDCMDITLMYAIIQSCNIKHDIAIHGNPKCIEAIKDTRNFLAHVPNGRISKSEFDSRWLETQQDILEIGSSLGNYFAKLYKRKIDDFKNSELSMDAIKRIIENNVDEVIKKKLQTIIEDQRKSTVLIKDEIIDHLTKYKDELSIDIRNLRFEVKQYALASCCTEKTFDTLAGQVSQMNVAAGGPNVQITEKDNTGPVSQMNVAVDSPDTQIPEKYNTGPVSQMNVAAGGPDTQITEKYNTGPVSQMNVAAGGPDTQISEKDNTGSVSQMNVAAGGLDTQITEKDSNMRKCRVEWKLETPNTWNLPEIKETLERLSSLLRQWFEIEFVYVGSLVLSTLVNKNVLDNPDEMRTSIQLFLEKVVELCKIKADIPTVIKVELIIKPDELVNGETVRKNISPEMEMKGKDTTYRSFDCQNCQQKDEVISRLNDEIFEIGKEYSTFEPETIDSDLYELDPEKNFSDHHVNEAQEAAGSVLSQKTSFARLGHAVHHLIPKMLRELLAHFIPPDTLFNTIEKNHRLVYSIKPVDWSKIHEIGDKGYMDFSIPLIYVIMRSCISEIQPTKGWGFPPEAHEILLGDDVERCRRFLNYITYRGNTTVSNRELKAFFSDFKDVARRFEIFLGTKPNEFVSQFDVLETCSMDEDI